MLLDALWTWLTLLMDGTLYGTAAGGSDVGSMAGGTGFPPPED